MSLTAAEKAELAQLEKEVGTQAMRTPTVPTGLTPEERAEMQALEREVGQQAQAPGVAQTALEHGANATTLGYLPQLQAAAAKPIYGLMNAVTGNNVQPDSYVEERDRNAKRLAAGAEANPKTALAGTIGGAVVGGLATPVPALGAAKGILGAAARGAAYGGLMGLVQNPGDVDGEISPLQLGDRVANAGKGAALGGLVGGSAETVRKGIGAISKIPAALKNTAENQAFRSSGAMLKDFRAAGARGGKQAGETNVNKLGRFMLDEGLAGAGKGVDEVAENSRAIVEKSGQALEGIYKKAVAAAKDPAIFQNMPGLNPTRDKAEILKAVADDLGDSTHAKTALKKVGSYIDQLSKKYGDTTLDPKTTNDIKGFMDETINYSRNPLSKKPGTEQGFSSARKLVSKKIDDSIKYLGEKIGSPELVNALKQENARYGMSKQVYNIASDRVAREGANRMVSLTDTIAGGAGGAIGAGAASATGGSNPLDQGGGALAGGLLLGAANHFGRKYGPGLIAAGANRATPLAQAIAPVGLAANAIPPSSLLSRVATSSLEKKKGKKKHDSAPETHIQVPNDR